MTYFHLRDFDTDQPMNPNLSASRRFKSYAGLRGAEAKLARLLNDFKFVDAKTAVSQVDWDTASIIRL